MLVEGVRKTEGAAEVLRVMFARADELKAESALIAAGAQQERQSVTHW